MFFLRSKNLQIIVFFFIYLSQFSIFSKDNLYFYEEALRVEKLSPLMSIPLYEEFLKTAPEKQFFTSTVIRLFDLYYKNKRFEDLILLDSNYKLDKQRKEKANHLYSMIAKNIKIPENIFLEILNLSQKTDQNSKERILEIYFQNQNDYILNFIFAIKFKIGDFDSLKFILDEVEKINPVLRLFYMVKTNHPNTEENIYDVSKSTDLSNDQKMEILFLYGIYYQRNQNYLQSTRFFMSADSFYDSSKEKFSSRSLLEASKSLFLSGKYNESCRLIQNKSFNLQNESDQFILLFCDKTTNKELKNYKKTIQFLSERDGGMVFQKYLFHLKKYDKKI
jgi:hypothetical protein